MTATVQRAADQIEQGLLVLSQRVAEFVGPKNIKSSHGCFANSIDIIGKTVETIIGGKLRLPDTNLDY